MKIFKTERDWSDLERADKTALFVGVLIWALLEVGCFMESKRFAQIKNNVVKSEIVRQR